ncbi:MAG: PH domain-containing protein [Micrococcales bacterium]|nr:PH domain-containing protein [Micrococcales bacterium]MCL2667677.1 PH domain-containing protein [Micrococcales bacterium]
MSDGVGPFELADLPWTRVSARLVTARLLMAGVVLGVPAVAGAVAGLVLALPWVWVVTGVAVALMGWVVWLVPRQVRALGYAERDDDLLVVRGIMFRRLVVVPYGRLQYVDVQAGPVARWLGIARVQLHTAAPATDGSIPGLAPDEAARLRDRLASRGEAKLAGL